MGCCTINPNEFLTAQGMLKKILAEEGKENVDYGKLFSKNSELFNYNVIIENIDEVNDLNILPVYMYSNDFMLEYSDRLDMNSTSLKKYLLNEKDIKDEVLDMFNITECYNELYRNIANLSDNAFKLFLDKVSVQAIIKSLEFGKPTDIVNYLENLGKEIKLTGALDCSKLEQYEKYKNINIDGCDLVGTSYLSNIRELKTEKYLEKALDYHCRNAKIKALCKSSTKFRLMFK